MCRHYCGTRSSNNRHPRALSGLILPRCSRQRGSDDRRTSEISSTKLLSNAEGSEHRVTLERKKRGVTREHLIALRKLHALVVRTRRVIFVEVFQPSVGPQARHA